MGFSETGAWNRMGLKEQCQSELVAESSFSSITRCSKCQVYNLHIGPVSFRLEAEIFENFCGMIVEFFLRNDFQVSQREPVIHKH